MDIPPDIRPHAQNAISSIQQSVISAPCLIPFVATLPLVCTSPRHDRHESCAGVVAIMFEQEYMVNRLTYHTHPSNTIISALSAVTVITIDLLEQGPSADRDGGVPDATEVAVVLQRCVDGLLRLVQHTQLGVARLGGIQSSVLHSLEVLVWGHNVDLTTAMNITLDATLDTTSYLVAATETTRSHVSELHNVFRSRQALAGATALVDGVDGDLIPLRTSLLLNRLDAAWEDLQQDLLETVKDLRRVRHEDLASCLCVSSVAAGWYRRQHVVFEQGVEVAGVALAEVKDLKERINRATEKP
ncbi:hypothetical protein C8Q76DRAFT_795959 [Earliella scabrosa]|nr:hypothetical protein C8Q76DRAFT_795959 [Earliella scabrosa]